jgi:hypothetical protein
MARPRKQVLWDQWRRRIERQQRSGQSIAAFCRSENVSPQAFYAWKRKLRDAACAPADSPSRGAAAHARRSARVGERRSPGETTAGHAPEFLQLPVTATPRSPWIELALADGTVLRLPQQNVAALVTVLRVLRGERLEWAEAEAGRV